MGAAFVVRDLLMLFLFFFFLVSGQPSMAVTDQPVAVVVLSSACDSSMPMVSVGTDANLSYAASFGAGSKSYHGVYFEEEGLYTLSVENPPHSATFSVKMSCGTEESMYVASSRTFDNERTEDTLVIELSAWKFASFVVEVSDKSNKKAAPWNTTVTVAKVSDSLQGSCTAPFTSTVPGMGAYDTAAGVRTICNISGSLTLRQGNWHSITAEAGTAAGEVTLDVCPNKVDFSQPLDAVAKVFTQDSFVCPETPETVVQFGAGADASCKVSWMAKAGQAYHVFVSSTVGISSGPYTLRVYGNTLETSLVNDACSRADTSAGIVSSTARVNEVTARNGTRWFGFRSTEKSRTYTLKASCKTDNAKLHNMTVNVMYDCGSMEKVIGESSEGEAKVASQASYTGQPYKVSVDGCYGRLSFEVGTGSVSAGVIAAFVVLCVLAVAVVVCGVTLALFIRRKLNSRPAESNSRNIVDDAFDDAIEFDMEKEINKNTDKDSLINNTDY